MPKIGLGEASACKLIIISSKQSLYATRREDNKVHTHTRPFRPTAVSNDSFFPIASRTGQGGELNNLKVKNKDILFCLRKAQSSKPELYNK